MSNPRVPHVVGEALALMNCMIESGESHSDQSRATFRAAADAIKAAGEVTRPPGDALGRLIKDAYTILYRDLASPRYYLAHRLLERAMHNLEDAATAAQLAEQAQGPQG